MSWYIVSYDLRKEPDTAGYDAIYNALQSYPDWAWILESVWIVEGTSAKKIRDHLSKFLDDNDGLVVAELTGELCYQRVRKGTSKWLNERFACG